MRTLIHALPSASPGTARHLRSLHFGEARSGRKAYLQASLHADEVPPMLVAQSLIPRLLALESAGAIAGEIVLVPMANPVGLSQDLQGSPLGRFDLGTGANFNRRFLHLTPQLVARLEPLLCDDRAANTARIRMASRALLDGWTARTETEALKRQLQLLALDAELVLDLHCDNQAVMHVYAGTPQVEALRPLAGYLGAQALLHSEASGDEPFDETIARLWWELAEHFAGRFPIDPLACLAATVELRGETEVSHTLAEQDAQALLHFLAHQGHLALETPPPPQSCAATPLAGVEPVVAPVGGLIVFAKAPGDTVAAGDLVAEIIDPFTDARTPLHAQVSGLCFARVARRFATRGMRLCKIAGASAFRTGPLLSP